MIVAFSVGPDNTNPETGMSKEVSKAVQIVRDSGLPNSTNAMFTNIEGSWDEVMAVVKKAVFAAGENSTRIGLVLKADIRPGYDEGQLESKVERLEQHLK